MRLATLILPFSLSLFLLHGCGKEETAQSHLQRAQSLQKEGDHAGEVIELKNALKKNPELGEARLMLGMTYLDLGQGKAAIKELKKARKLGADAKEASNLLIEALLQTFQFQEVLDELEKLPADFDATKKLLIRAQANLGLNELKTASKAFNDVIKTDENNIDAHLGLATIAIGNQKYPEAQTHIEKILSISPDHARTLLLKGETFLITQKLDEAQAAFEQVINQNNPTFLSTARLGAARALFAKDKIDEAKKLIELVLKQNRKNLTANYLMGVLSYRDKDFDQARISLQEVLRVNPNHAKSLMLMGVLDFMDKQYEQSQEKLNKYLKVDPGHVPARKLLANIFLINKHPEDAIKTLEPIIPTVKEDAQFFYLLGNAYTQASNPSKATYYLQKASELAPDATEISTQLAISHLVSGSREEAIAELESINSKGDSQQAAILLTLTDLQDRKFESAKEKALDLINKYDKNPMAYNFLGAAYLGLEKPDEAEQYFEKALELAPSFSPAALNLAKIKFKNKQPDKAIEILENTLSLNPTDATLLVELAKVAEIKKDHKKAETMLQKARRENPDALQPRLLLGSYFARTGRSEEAKNIVKEVEKLAGDNPQVLKFIAEVNLSTGKTKEGIKILQDLTQIDPAKEGPWLNLAGGLMATKDYAGAKQAFEKVLQLTDGKAITPLYSIGVIELIEGNYEKVKGISNQLISTFPDKADGYVLSGDTFLKQNNFADAIPQFKTALEKSANNVILLKLARTYKEMGDADKSIALLKAWMSDHPDDKKVQLVLAGSNMTEGDKDKALNTYLDILKKQPDNAIALNNIAWIYFERNDEKALEYATKALNAAPKSPEIMDTVGWIRIQMKQLEQGTRLLEKAVEGRPTNNEIRYHYAVGLSRTEETQAAIEQLKKALEGNQEFTGIEDARTLLKSLQ